MSAVDTLNVIGRKQVTFEYRVPPTIEIIDGKEYERMHFLDACKKQ